MADRRSLGILGLVFGGVTAAVMLIAVIVVKQHVDGRVTLDQARQSVMAAAAPVAAGVKAEVIINNVPIDTTRYYRPKPPASGGPSGGGGGGGGGGQLR